MVANDSMRNAQSQSVSAISHTRREKGVEDLGLIALCDSAAIVMDLDSRGVMAGGDEDRDALGIGSGLDCVRQKIDQDLFDLD